MSTYPEAAATRRTSASILVALLVGALLVVSGRLHAWWVGGPSRVVPPQRSSAAREFAPAVSGPGWNHAPMELGEATVTFRPTVRGEPLRDVAPDALSFTLQAYDVTTVPGGPEGTTEAYGPRGALDRPWTFHDGKIEVERVPAGYYGVKVTVRRGSGDLVGSMGYTFHAAQGPGTADLPLIEMMRLRRPHFPEKGRPYPRIASPVELAWEPVVGAARYAVMLAPMFDVAEADVREINAALTQPRWLVDVPPGGWMINLEAFDEHGQPVAALFGELTFVVRPPAS
jgi:hypothetical protein